jgi:DMSO/TMAO reductase YedYZ molybdopterin-dependent catalytic subunit
MNSGQVLPIAAGLIIIAGLVFVLFGLPSGPGDATVLPSVEIRSYQGTDLSSISDFRENSISGPQHVSISDYRLTVAGLTNATDVYTYRDVLEQFPHYSKVVTLVCVEGWQVTILWEGVQVRDLIRHAGPDPRANTVVFTAHDGYTTSFPLDYLLNRDIIMAYRMNNVTLPAARGYPFQLVAEDKWGYKWIKWIEKIELTDDPSYRGFWEERGFSNSGDLDRSYLSR